MIDPADVGPQRRPVVACDPAVARDVAYPRLAGWVKPLDIDTLPLPPGRDEAVVEDTPAGGGE